MKALFSYLDRSRMSLRYLVKLPGFFSHPLSLQECYAMVERQIQNRKAIFLAQFRRAVYSNPRSPYYKLLQHAQCGDLERMVQQEGLLES